MANYVKAVWLDEAALQNGAYYTRLPAVRALVRELRFERPVTFFVGENGSGKSTLLEAIAVACGFNPEGGTINFNFSSTATHAGLYEDLQLRRGAVRNRDGFFLRAESFYNVATEVERLSAIPTRGGPLYNSYGGASLHEQSHGESFMALVQNRFGGRGLYVLDEPEAALSPARQLVLLGEMQRLVNSDSQFIISTHSPILLAYPEADIYQLDEGGLTHTQYRDTQHYQLTRQFLNNPEVMLRVLLEEE